MVLGTEIDRTIRQREAKDKQGCGRQTWPNLGVANKVFITKDYHVVVLIPESTIEILEPKNLYPPSPPFAQVDVNLLGGHIDLSKLRNHASNLPNMDLLESLVSFDTLPNKIMEPPQYEPRLDRSLVHWAIC